MGCPGLHCDGCGSGGPTAGAVIALIVLGVLAAAHRAIEHAAIDVLHFIEIALIVIAGLGLTASVVAMTVLTFRIRGRRRSRAALPAPVTVRAVSAPRRESIGAPEHHQWHPQAAERPTVQARVLP
jgi:hypothetical protein